MTEAASIPAADASPEDLRTQGLAALERHDWPTGFQLLRQADAAGRLGAQDLESLAEAAFFTAQPDLEVEVLERAFAAYEVEGDPTRAAYVAVAVAEKYAFVGKFAITAVWIRRAERLIGTDGDTYVHGYIAMARSWAARAGGDLEAAMALAQRAVEIGERVAHADLKASAMTNLGELKIAAGAPNDGLALMEEASVAAISGDLSPFVTGVTACRMISACRDLTDYRRASEWIEATEKYCHRQSLSGFPGICRIHRAEVAAVGGAWDQAQHELERATAELTAYRATAPQADGYYAIADLHRLKGDWAAAEAALRQANELGHSPQPALAFIRLAQGQVAAAASAINAAVLEQRGSLRERGRLLPAQVEISIAARDVPAARGAVDGLAAIVETYPSPALVATQKAALGRVLLAEGDAAAAVAELRGAIVSWREVGAPYEIARVRAVLAQALRRIHDDDVAALEAQAARDEFERLGAVVDLAALEREGAEAVEAGAGASGSGSGALGASGASVAPNGSVASGGSGAAAASGGSGASGGTVGSGGTVSARRTFMFTDIVRSTNLAEALGDAAWEQLLHWHDETLRGLIGGGGGEVVNSTGDGFFAAFESARAAVDCACSIQRALRDHRARAGFAPAVRIGLHTAEANRRGGEADGRQPDYSGVGVHVAARVEALAEGGEILATAETLAEAGEVAASASRAAQVKGVSAALEVASISWS